MSEPLYGGLEPETPRAMEIASPRLRFDIFSLFPGMFAGPLDESILRRAQERGLIKVGIHNIRDWTMDRHHTADDTPYGGGAGMVMKAPPIVDAVERTLGDEMGKARILVMSAGGRLFTQTMAAELAEGSPVAIVCGRYEGIDQRAIEALNAEEVSIGDFVVTGGELPAMIVIDAVSRLVPGVIDAASVAEESHQHKRVEYPHYTRPFEFRGLQVPAVLLSGHHAEIARWRYKQGLRRTAQMRPDLLIEADLTTTERGMIESELNDHDRDS